MNEQLIAIQQTNLDILEKLNKLQEKIDSANCATNGIETLRYIIPAIIVLYITFNITKIFKFIKLLFHSVPTIIQTNEKITDSFYDMLFESISTILNGDFTSAEISNLIEALKKNPVECPIDTIHEMGYTVEKQNISEFKISIHVILQHHSNFVKKSTERVLDADFIPNSLMKALVESPAHQIRIEMFKRR